jgi:hypothetical protein
MYDRCMTRSRNVYFPADHTPEEWRNMARDRYRSADESFERCDTDGYLSQWASQVTAQLYELCARVAEAGGLWEFTVLADADGTTYDTAREVKTRYGWTWIVPTEHGDVWFNPSHARNEERRRAADLAKGFQFITVQKRAVVIMAETGGLWGCTPTVVPQRD